MSLKDKWHSGTSWLPFPLSHLLPVFKPPFKECVSHTIYNRLSYHLPWDLDVSYLFTYMVAEWISSHSICLWLLLSNIIDLLCGW